MTHFGNPEFDREFMEIREATFSELAQVLSLYDEYERKNHRGHLKMNRRTSLKNLGIAAVVFWSQPWNPSLSARVR